MPPNREQCQHSYRVFVRLLRQSVSRSVEQSMFSFSMYSCSMCSCSMCSCCMCSTLFRREAPWRVGASHCEERGGALHACFLCFVFFFGEKHHGGWGLLNVKRGVGLFAHYFMLWLCWRETQWGLGASQCEMRVRVLHALFLSFVYPYNKCSYRPGFTNVKSCITIVKFILRS
jgi:hypothetical protein